MSSHCVPQSPQPPPVSINYHNHYYNYPKLVDNTPAIHTPKDTNNKNLVGVQPGSKSQPKFGSNQTFKYKGELEKEWVQQKVQNSPPQMQTRVLEDLTTALALVNNPEELALLKSEVNKISPEETIRAFSKSYDDDEDDDLGGTLPTQACYALQRSRYPGHRVNRVNMPIFGVQGFCQLYNPNTQETLCFKINNGCKDRKSLLFCEREARITKSMKVGFPCADGRF